MDDKSLSKEVLLRQLAANELQPAAVLIWAVDQLLVQLKAIHEALRDIEYAIYNQDGLGGPRRRPTPTGE